VRVIAATVLLICGCASVVAAAEDTPILTLDTGGHMATVAALAFTPDGTQVISAGHDKVIRVWDWRADEAVRMIRGQSGPGLEGMIYAIALSPNGRWLAVGGFLGPQEKDVPIGAIRLYDFASGQLKQLLNGHDNAVFALAFSPDGKRLISGSGDNSAIIWEVESGRILHQLSGHQSSVVGVAFNGNGALVATASRDRTLKLWSADGELRSTLEGHTRIVNGVAFSPADQSVVSASWDHTVKFWDIETGQLKRSIDRDCGEGLSYTPDGRFVVCSEGAVIDTRTYEEKINHAPSTGRKAVISPDGRLAATVNEQSHAVLIWEIETGRTVATLDSTGNSIWALGFSPDGCDLAWGHTTKTPLQVNDMGDVDLEISIPCTAERPISAPRRISRQVGAYTKPVTKHGDIELELAGPNAGNMNLLHAKRGSMNIATLDARTRGFRHQVYTFTPDGKTVLSGGANGQLHAYEIESGKVARFDGHTGYVYALAVSPDGKLAASGATDKTINIWNTNTGELIVTFFYGSDGEWVMWTPQGYYTSSPNGDTMIGWQINKGSDQAADYVTANQLRTHFYRPDIVQRAIFLASATTAVAQARSADLSLSDLLKRRPPAFDIISPQHGAHASATPVELQLKLELNDDPIQAIEVLVNGRQATTPTLRNATARLASLGVLERRIEVPLEQGENNIRIVARNQVGQTSRDFILFHDRPGILDARGRLYVLAIGVDKYPHLPAICGDGRQNCDLRYAAEDARAFRDVLVKQMGPLHKEVRTLLLSQNGDKPPTRANIEDALGEMLGKAGPEDTTVLFIAGHGVNDGLNSDYLFLPQDAQPTSNGWRKSTVMPWVLLQNALHNTQGRRLMFADTCHSGGAYNARLVNDAASANIIVFSATDTQTVSWEFEHLGHGAFTYALIQGLEGKARRNDGSVTLLRLGEFVSEEVASLTKDKQQPTFHMSGAKNFTLAKQ
jgi:WD40 repeat protein